MSINNVVLVGRLCRDPELRKTPTGLSTTTFSVACDRRTKQGEQKQADFITCVAWRQSADFLTKYGHKGDIVGIDGRIQTRNYDDPKDPGRKVYVTEIQCNDVQIIQSAEKKPTEAQKQPDGVDYAKAQYGEPGFEIDPNETVPF